jgi:uncharacterized protein (TIGR02453 family)
MPFTGFSDEAYAFYEGLRADNSKTYWTDHKAVYETHVREPMLALTEQLATEFAPAKVFRPHRDVRFAADKSPYKTHAGAFAALGEALGWYVQLDADGVYVAGGFYSATAQRTARYRAAVDDPRTGSELVAILAKLDRAGFQRGGAQVRTRPRGVPPDHPRLDLMRHESLTAGRLLPDSALASGAKTLAAVRTQWRALRPLNEWLLANL